MTSWIPYCFLADVPLTKAGGLLLHSTRKTTDGEFVSRKGGGGSKQAVIEVVLDGYSAPLTAGHFAQLVQEKYYDNAPIVGCVWPPGVDWMRIARVGVSGLPGDELTPSFRHARPLALTRW
jgi:hypothetical protein